MILSRNDRSNTVMDTISQFTPGALAGMRGTPWGMLDYAAQYDTDTANQYGTAPGLGRVAGWAEDSGISDWNTVDPTFDYGTDAGYRVQSAPSESGFSLDSALKTASSWFSTLTQFEAQRKLMNLNIERAKSGLPPISPASVAPQINVGLTPRTLLAGGGGLMMLAAAALGYAVLSRGGARARRRRR
jgi:hypothetical protein